MSFVLPWLLDNFVTKKGFPPPSWRSALVRQPIKGIDQLVSGIPTRIPTSNSGKKPRTSATMASVVRETNWERILYPNLGDVLSAIPGKGVLSGYDFNTLPNS